MENDNYYAIVNSETDYYPFGMIMPGRSYSAASSYGFGFNKGSLKDDEIKGDGNSYSTVFRELDVRVPIWWGIDPVPKAFESPYISMGDNPIWFNDYLGNTPTPKEAARMARHVYGDKDDKYLKGGWKPSKRGIYGVIYKDSKTGLKSMLYERVITHGKNKGKTEYTYATAGTDGTDKKDWENNIEQEFGLSTQYDESVKNSKNISTDLSFTKSELTFTGHSLGGGEASLNAVVTGRHAITFNAAGLSTLTLHKIWWDKVRYTF